MPEAQVADRSGKRPPSRWAGVLFLLFFIAFLASVLEIGARVVISRSGNTTLQRVIADYRRLATEGASWIRFVPDPELSYRLRPDFEIQGRSGGRVTRHNAEGFRDLKPFAPKDPSVLRIACYGASTTYGVGVEDNQETYPAQLEAALSGPYRPAGWERVEVFNLGVGGYTSREILGTMRRTLPELKPDVVLIQNAINDVIPRFYPNYAADYSHFRIPFASLEVTAARRLLYRSEACLALAYGLGWIRPLSLQSQTQLPMPPAEEAVSNLEKNAPAAYEENLTAAIALAQESGSRVWLLTQAYLDVPEFAGPTAEARQLESGYRTGLREHNTLLRILAREKGAGLIDLDETMPRQRGYFTDPIHMSVEGNRVKADLIAAALAPDLGDTPDAAQ